MSIIGKKIKQPRDIADYDVDYSDWLRTGETLQTVSVFRIDCVTTPADTSLTASAETGIVAARIRCVGGLDRKTYKVTIQATTTTDRLKESEIIIKVKEF